MAYRRRRGGRGRKSFRKGRKFVSKKRRVQPRRIGFRL